MPSLVGLDAPLSHNYDATAQSTGVPQLTSTNPTRVHDHDGAEDAAPRRSEQKPVTSRNTADTAVSEKLQTEGAENLEVEDEMRDEEVHELARRYTTASQYSLPDGNPYHAKEDSPLNPHSPNFNPRAWAKALLNLQAKDPDKFPQRTAGFAFKNLSVHGFGQATDYQKSVGNVLFQSVGLARSLMGSGKRKIDILQSFEGVVHAGEMLVVLGPPGSGCSTFLKTIAGETSGIYVSKDSYINYQGISSKQMAHDFRGEATYTAEVDVHFPNMLVGDTLYFAARARSPRHLPGGIDRKTFAEYERDVIMAVFGISHTVNTNVGNDFVRGVSGGERKRVTIAEAALSRAPLQCWDNSTRGLDSANAIEFCKTLKRSSDLVGTTACVAIYQAPQAAYDYFDKVLVLYEGRQIFFGRADQGRGYFEKLGFECPARQTTADFLTSMTSPQERIVRAGFENRAPRTPDEFAAQWKDSPERAALLLEIEAYEQDHPIGGADLQQFKASMKAMKAKSQRASSPYTLSYSQQVMLCLWRGFVRLKGDPSLTFVQLFGNSVMALILGSIWYNLQPNTASFYQRGALIFFAVLMNGFGAALEILTLYAQRPIVEKHSRYALYHPSAEAFASMLTDLPYKFGNAIFFNVTLYFMTHLRREPGPFFFFLFVSFLLTLVMSMMFRTIASLSRTLTQALAPAAILILAIVIYTGFAIPRRYLVGWSAWIADINFVGYGFESLMINEFHNRNFTCSTFVPTGPSYTNVAADNRVCSAVGSQPGSSIVNGDAYINSAFQYYHSHKWRNVGFIFAFIIFFMLTYLAAAEYITAKKSKGEVLVYRRGHAPASVTKKSQDDVESGSSRPASIEKRAKKDEEALGHIQKQTSVFSWRDVSYDIKIKSENRRILDRVDGWVKPGTLTALMGVSGAGKTTLLDVLASRATVGVVSSGEMLVDGRTRDESFQRKTGYAMQSDIHLQTSTVREALNFSALLRQPAQISRREKLAYVDEVIKLLDMEEYADAVVGVPGEGLNVEQRKRLTIGVELAAKPELLLFLDEPTSGLDSQTSWAICDLMEKLTKSGQAILCTIHQPSAMLFQRFDRLLFLAKGGRTVYFGEIGKNSKTLIDYFERNGGPSCPNGANPAEWMMEVIGAAPGSFTDIDWPETWRSSAEYDEVQEGLDTLRLQRTETTISARKRADKASYREFAAPFWQQLWQTNKRVFQQYWRTPSYIYSKIALCLFSALFVGFSFYKAKNSIQGLQNQMFSLFMLMTIFGQLVQQIMPNFVTQRSLYEARERPAKTYSWKAFMLSNIFVELPWQTLMAVIMFVCWYYPVGLYRNADAAGMLHERGALMFLFLWQFLVFTSTFTNMVIAGVDTAESGGNFANLMFMLCLVFCGVLATPQTMPGFWIFMYRISPFTYIISGMLSTAVGGTDVVCAENEFLHFSPSGGQSCADYMASYIRSAGGYLQEPGNTSECSYCPLSSTDAYLAGVNSSYSTAWRNWGIVWSYVVFNIAAALVLYWLLRVPKKKKKSKKE